VIVYAYGIHSPHEGADWVSDQMRLAGRYRNVLVAIERARRAALRELLRETDRIGPHQKAAEEAKLALEQAIEVVRKKRGAARKRADTEADRDAIRACRETHRKAVASLRDARREAKDDPRIEKGRALINDKASLLKKSAREYSGLYWGTYLRVEDAAQNAGKMPLYDGEAPSDPHFVRYDGSGEVAVQLQNGLPLEEALSGKDNRVRISLPQNPDRAWHHPSSGERHRHARTAKLRLRVGSREDKSPIWAEWVVDMHRPMPKGALLKWVSVKKIRQGPHFRWKLCITFDAPIKALEDNGGVLALNLGWRQKKDGTIRVGRYAGSDGQEGELVLSEKLLSQLREPNHIRAQRDHLLEICRLDLSAWLKARPDLPAWLVEATRSLPSWRQASRYASLLFQWRDKRFPGDDYPVAKLDGYVHHDRHLWAAESRRRERSLGHRREVYRVFAATMADKYGTIVLEKFDLREVAKRKSAEDTKVENEQAMSNRHLAALSILRQALASACLSRGRTLVSVDAVHATHTCPSCSEVGTFDASGAIEWTCTGCGTTWDQDLAAAKNDLRLYEDDPSGAKVLVAPPSEVPVVRESRWNKAKKRKAEKMQQGEART
jgi:hypothetical protein